MRLLLGILTSLLSNSIHCCTTWLTPGSELFTSWKPVMLAPPFLRSVRSISRKPCDDKTTQTDGRTDKARDRPEITKRAEEQDKRTRRWVERQTSSTDGSGSAVQCMVYSNPVVHMCYGGAIKNTGRTRDQETGEEAFD